MIEGMRINVIPVSFGPKLKLADHVYVSPQFRADIDLWLLAMFGAKDTTPLPRGTMALSGRNLSVREDDYQAMKLSMLEEPNAGMFTYDPYARRY